MQTHDLAMCTESRRLAMSRLALWGICLTFFFSGTIVDAATLTGVQSRKAHGSPPTDYNLTVDTTQDIGGAVTVEPRAIGSGHRIVFQFDSAVTAVGTPGATDESGASAGQLALSTLNGSEVTVTLTAVADNKRIRLVLPAVNGGADAVVSLGFLVGDVDNSRSVSPVDVQQIKSRSGQGVDAGNFRFDLNATGVISAADVVAIRSRVPRTLTGLTAAATFTTQPASVTITAGQTAQFVAVAIGTPAPTLRWQLSIDNGGTWSDIPGATGSGLSIAGALSDSGRQYRAIATNTVGAVNSHVATLTVNAAPPPKAWQAAALIGPAVDGDVYNERIALGANGDAVAVWQDIASAGPAVNIWANRYSPATGWGTPTIIGGGADGAADPQVGVDGGGNAIAVWVQPDGIYDYSSGNPVPIRYNIWSNRYVPGSGWTGAALIETLDGDAFTPRSAGEPQIAVANNGRAIAVWNQGNAFNSGADVWANTYSPGGGWAVAGILSDGSSSAGGAVAAIDAAGNTMAVWSQVVGTHINLFASRNGGAAVQIESGTGNPSSTQVAMNANGEAFAVWGQGCVTWANRFVPASGWGTAIALQSGNPACAYIPDGQIAVDANGNALAAWVLRTGASTTTYGNRYNAGAGWQGASPINFGGQHFQFAMNAAGNTLGTWQSGSLLAGNGAFVTAYDFSPSVPIYGGSGIDSTGSRIAMDANGNAIVLFKRAEVAGVRNTIWAAVYK